MSGLVGDTVEHRFLLSRLRRVASLVGVDEETAKRAGQMRHRVGTQASAADAIVATIASFDGSTILTSDPDDLKGLVDALGSGRVHRV